MTFGKTLGRNFLMAASVNVLYVNIDYKNKTYMEVAASHINIKIHSCFLNSKFLVSALPIVQRKISDDLTQTCF